MPMAMRLPLFLAAAAAPLALGEDPLSELHADTSSCEVDLVMMIDTSCGINAKEWAQASDFVTKFAANLTLGPNSTWLGIIEFAKNVSNNLFPTGSRTDVDHAIQNRNPASSMGCQTRTGFALQAALQMVQFHGRPNVTKVVMLVTDGRPRPLLWQGRLATQYANELRALGVRLLGVGVGTKAADRAAIQALCTRPTDYFNVTSFAALDGSLKLIVQDACMKQKWECRDEAVCFVSVNSSLFPDFDSRAECEAACRPPPAPPTLATAREVSVARR